MIDKEWIKSILYPEEFGIAEQGNIDLYHRPLVKMPDGGTATVWSHTYDLPDGRFILLPGITSDGRILGEGLEGRAHDDDVVNHYRKTNQHLGIFNSLDAANRYAELLHNAQANYYGL